MWVFPKCWKITALDDSRSTNPFIEISVVYGRLGDNDLWLATLINVILVIDWIICTHVNYLVELPTLAETKYISWYPLFLDQLIVFGVELWESRESDSHWFPMLLILMEVLCTALQSMLYLWNLVQCTCLWNSLHLSVWIEIFQPCPYVVVGWFLPGSQNHENIMLIDCKRLFFDF